jgi:outer membrane lipoprotein SlyB
VSATDSDGGGLVDTASSGIDGLATAATATLGVADPDGVLRQPVAASLRDVWEGYFGVPIPPGDTNWNAYTHQQLYDMLWQNADVADVGSVADQWDQHGAELTSQAGELRDRQATLRSTWTGDAADSATSALGRLGDQTQAIGTRASSVGQAARQAGDALTVARNTMPPPTDLISNVIAGAETGAGVGAKIGSAVGGAFTAGFGAGPGAAMGAAMGAVAGGAASMFLGSADAAQRKAEAVRVMLAYESSLRDAAQAVPATVADTAGIGSGGAPGTTTTSAFVGGGGLGGFGGIGGIGAGVPWQRLVGANSGVAALRSGAMSGAFTDAALARAGVLAAEGAASEMANMGGAYPPGARRGRGGEDEEHPNKMPKATQDHFSIEGGSVVPVIGGTDQ